jgi:hypothetical protein
MTKGEMQPCLRAQQVESLTRSDFAVAGGPGWSARDSFPLGRALASLWTLNAAMHPPVEMRKGCPVLPRFVPVAKGIDGLRAVYDPNSVRFHENTMRLLDGSSAELTECPFR